ncbi:hypothetical protein BDZ97DRAFT_1808776 [Flammula alnicola]|nr:hypothetical protein BDZ97DRAFT_1808776 [Flammula alnicola]
MDLPKSTKFHFRVWFLSRDDTRTSMFSLTPLLLIAIYVVWWWTVLGDLNMMTLHLRSL